MKIVVFLLINFLSYVPMWGCPTDLWTLDESKQTCMYYGRVSSNIQNTFEDAKNYCRGIGGSLAILRSEQIENEFKNIVSKKDGTKNVECWMSLQRHGPGSSFSWNGEKISHENWVDGEVGNGDCVVFTQNGWKVKDCHDSTVECYLCSRGAVKVEVDNKMMTTESESDVEVNLTPIEPSQNRMKSARKRSAFSDNSFSSCNSTGIQTCLLHSEGKMYWDYGNSSLSEECASHVEMIEDQSYMCLNTSYKGCKTEETAVNVGDKNFHFYENAASYPSLLDFDYLTGMKLTSIYRVRCVKEENTDMAYVVDSLTSVDVTVGQDEVETSMGFCTDASCTFIEKNMSPEDRIYLGVESKDENYYPAMESCYASSTLHPSETDQKIHLLTNYCPDTQRLWDTFLERKSGPPWQYIPKHKVNFLRITARKEVLHFPKFSFLESDYIYLTCKIKLCYKAYCSESCGQRNLFSPVTSDWLPHMSMNGLVEMTIGPVIVPKTDYKVDFMGYVRNAVGDILSNPVLSKALGMSLVLFWVQFIICSWLE